MPTVGPIRETNVPMVYDSDSAGFAAPADMRGPENGSVAYTQAANGSLQLRIRVEFGQVNTKYQVYLVCGPSHATACGFVTIGTLTTNAAGAGAAAITVPLAVLQAAPFGPGFRNDHLDLIGNDPRTSILSVGAINYYICRGQAGGAAKAKAGAAAAAGMETGSGDPLKTAGGSKVKIGSAKVSKKR
ncbi:MAG: hypothetical protein ICV60_06515 [Pyrinomonadaceae bacterium]|nr:hypothetical protein [Pyrinomonadaceae bacterium]